MVSAAEAAERIRIIFRARASERLLLPFGAIPLLYVGKILTKRSAIPVSPKRPLRGLCGEALQFTFVAALDTLSGTAMPMASRDSVLR